MQKSVRYLARLAIQRAARKVKRFITGKCGCFTAATLVMTANGAVPIVDIEEGQQVLAAPDDGLSESYSSNTVGTKIVVGEANLVQLIILHEDGSSEVINTTDEHPFHVADTAEWTRADGLIIGDHLSTISGASELIGVVYTTDRVPVYNLSIPGTPTYYVGEHGVWVHNCPTLTDLHNATKKMDRNGFTFGGRALQKHASRTRSLWKSNAKNARDFNADADWQILEVLTNPSSSRTQARSGRIDILHPDGRGIRFNSDGTFYSFLN